MIVALGSIRGAPGVTSWAVLLAAAWPPEFQIERVVLEADPAGGVLGARYGLGVEPGVAAFLASLRRNDAELLDVEPFARMVDNHVWVMPEPETGEHRPGGLGGGVRCDRHAPRRRSKDLVRRCGPARRDESCAQAGRRLGTHRAPSSDHEARTWCRYPCMSRACGDDARRLRCSCAARHRSPSTTSRSSTRARRGGASTRETTSYRAPASRSADGVPGERGRGARHSMSPTVQRR